MTTFVSSSLAVVGSECLAVSLIDQSAPLEVTDWFDESREVAQSGNLTYSGFRASKTFKGSGSFTIVTPVTRSSSLAVTSEGTTELKETTTDDGGGKSTIDRLILPLVIGAAVIGLILIIVVVYLVVRYARTRATYYYEEEEEELGETGAEFAPPAEPEHWFENPDGDEFTTLAGEDLTIGGDLDSVIDAPPLAGE